MGRSAARAISAVIKMLLDGFHWVSSGRFSVATFNAARQLQERAAKGGGRTWSSRHQSPYFGQRPAHYGVRTNALASISHGRAVVHLHLQLATTEACLNFQSHRVVVDAVPPHSTPPSDRGVLQKRSVRRDDHFLAQSALPDRATYRALAVHLHAGRGTQKFRYGEEIPESQHTRRIPAIGDKLFDARSFPLECVTSIFKPAFCSRQFLYLNRSATPFSFREAKCCLFHFCT